MEDDNLAALGRYAFAAVFIVACLYSLKLGVQVAGVYIAGLSLYGSVLGKVRLVDWKWSATGYLTGTAAQAVSLVCILFGIVLFFFPDWVISALLTISS